MYTSISIAKFMQNNEKLYIDIQILTKSTLQPFLFKNTNRCKNLNPLFNKRLCDYKKHYKHINNSNGLTKHCNVENSKHYPSVESKPSLQHST